MAEPRCSMCGSLGWVLDCNDLNKPGPRMVELIPCFHPECKVERQTIQSLCFKGPEFKAVSRHPGSGVIMSVSRGADQQSPPDPARDPGIPTRWGAGA